MASATLIAFFLLSALTFYPPSTTAQPVTDVNGKIVKNGGRFYMLPSLIGGYEGGIRRVQTDNESIPLSVAVSRIPTDKGLPVTISALIQTTFLPEGPVSLSFEYTPLFGVASLEWTAVEGLPEGTLVKIRGYPNTITGSFSIKKFEVGRLKNSYILLFCEGVLCGNVGIVRNSDGNLLLAVTQDYPYVFHLEPYLPTSADA